MPDMDVEEICLISAGGILVDTLNATDPLEARENGDIERVKFGALAYARAKRLI